MVYTSHVKVEGGVPGARRMIEAMPSIGLFEYCEGISGDDESDAIRILLVNSRHGMNKPMPLIGLFESCQGICKTIGYLRFP